MKAQFECKLQELMREQCRPFLLSNEQYKCMIEETKTAKEKKQMGLKMSSKDYRRLKRFDVIKFGEREHLIQKSDLMNIKYFCPASDLFEVLKAAHLKLGHKREKAMEAELKNRFCNITREVINVYLELCKPCALKKRSKKKGLVVQALTSSTLNSRCQEKEDVSYDVTYPATFKQELHFEDPTSHSPPVMEIQVHEESSKEKENGFHSLVFDSIDSPQKVSFSPPEDELDLFGRSMVAQMRQLSEEYVVEIMSEIQNLLANKRLKFIADKRQSAEHGGECRF